MYMYNHSLSSSVGGEPDNGWLSSMCQSWFDSVSLRAILFIFWKSVEKEEEKALNLPFCSPDYNGNHHILPYSPGSGFRSLHPSFPVSHSISDCRHSLEKDESETKVSKPLPSVWGSIPFLPRVDGKIVANVVVSGLCIIRLVLMALTFGVRSPPHSFHALPYIMSIWSSRGITKLIGKRQGDFVWLSSSCSGCGSVNPSYHPQFLHLKSLLCTPTVFDGSEWD